MTAHKYYDDHFYTNEFYGKISGIKLNDINDLESYFLCSLNFELYINDDESLPKIDVNNIYI